MLAENSCNIYYRRAHMFFKKRGHSSIRQWWWEIDTILLTMILAIMSIGALLITTASPSVAERIGLPSFYFFHRHIVFLIIAAMIMFIFSYLPEKYLRKLCLLGFLATLCMMATLPFVGDEVKGAKRWISLAGVSIQPSEFLKPFMATVVGMILAERNNQGTLPGFSMVGLLYVVAIGLLLIQPDFGMSVSMTVVTAGQLFMAGLSIFWIAVSIGSGIGGIILAYFALPHVTKRIDSFLHPEDVENYQIERSLEAYERGGFFGRGPGEGQIKSILPDSHTDFIFAVAGEELGAIVSIMILSLFFAVIMRMSIQIYKSKNLFHIYATCGLLLHFAFQTIFNVGVTLHLLPTKGMTLPFISYGGSSIISFAIALGICLNFTRKWHNVELSKNRAQYVR